MYIISKPQAQLFIEYLQESQGLHRGEVPIFLKAKPYDGEDVTLSIQSYKEPGSMGIRLGFGARPLEMAIRDTVLVPVNWKDPSEIDTLIYQLKNGGVLAYSELPSGLENGRVIRDASIFYLRDGCIVIDVEPDNVLCIDGINEPEDIITAFNLIQKVATAIGHPIVYDSITRSKLGLEYFNDIKVDKAPIRKAKKALAEKEKTEWSVNNCLPPNMERREETEDI